MDQFKAIESVGMSVKHAKRKKEMGKKIDPGRAQLGEKMDQLVLYTSLVLEKETSINNNCSQGNLYNSRWWML